MEKKDMLDGLVKRGQGNSAEDVVFNAYVFGGCVLAAGLLILVIVLRPLLCF